MKIHQQEFEILPKVWQLLVDANSSVLDCVSALQSAPDMNKMTSEEVEEILGKCQFHESQKREIRTSVDKTRIFFRVQMLWKLGFSRRSCNNLREYLLKSGIFIPHSIKNKLDQYDFLLFGALIEREMDPHYEDRANTPKDSSKRLIKEHQSLMAEIQTLIQEKLYAGSIQSQATRQ